MAKGLRVALAILLGGLVLLALIAVLILEIAENKSGPITGIVALLLAVGFLAFLRFVDVDALLRGLEALRFAAPIFAYVGVSLFVGDKKGATTFNEVAAQIIVVLLLALAIETRFFQIRSELGWLERGSILFTFLVLAAGEWYALRGLLIDEPAPAQVTAGAIAAGFAAIGVGALAGLHRGEG